MKIGFYHEIAEKDLPYWKDGLWAAMQEVGKEHEVNYFGEGDVIMVETGSHGSQMHRVLGMGGKKIWLHAGGAPEDYPFSKVVVLADQIKRWFARKGIEAITINGTNTDIFHPFRKKKIYDVIFPANFASWKRHELLVAWTRKEKIDPARVLVIGRKQQVEQETYKICESEGFNVRDPVTPEELAVLYNQSSECWIPSLMVGGSEKTLLEARACGLKVRVADDNERLIEMLTQPVHDHHHYAAELKKLL